MNVSQLPARDRFVAPADADALRAAIAEKCAEAARKFVMASTIVQSVHVGVDTVTLHVPMHSADWRPEYADAIYAAGRAIGQVQNFNFLMRAEPNSLRLRAEREKRYGT